MLEPPPPQGKALRSPLPTVLLWVAPPYGNALGCPSLRGGLKGALQICWGQMVLLSLLLLFLLLLFPQQRY